MSGINPETEDSAWTKANLQKLLAAMKTSIPERERYNTYTKGMKALIWKKVAFPPFSPEECQEKWLEMFQRMRKIRTLTELITEAEEVISSHPDALKKYHAPPRHGTRNKKRKRLSKDTSDDGQSSDDEEGLPSKPPINGYNLFCKEQLQSMDGISKSAYVSVCGKRWRDLTEDQRDEYSTRCTDLKNEYFNELNECLMTLDKTKRKQILKKHGIKKSKVKTKKMKKFPGEPEKPLRSSNLIFFKEQMEILKEEFPNSNKRFTKVSQMWKDLSDREKRQYREKVKENFSKYMMELQKWFKTLKPPERDDYLRCNPRQSQYLDFTLVQLFEKEESSHGPSQMQDLNSKQVQRYEKEGSTDARRQHRPSDSEDEDIEDSSSDEEQSKPGSEESEEEEGDDIAFDMY
ncbi:upstream-binding factor 1-like protein 1 [Symphorus nematophorus]